MPSTLRIHCIFPLWHNLKWLSDIRSEPSEVSRNERMKFIAIKAVIKHNIIQSMNSAGGRCRDNARCESMWARMKSELFCRI